MRLPTAKPQHRAPVEDSAATVPAAAIAAIREGQATAAAATGSKTKETVGKRRKRRKHHQRSGSQHPQQLSTQPRPGQPVLLPQHAARVEARTASLAPGQLYEAQAPLLASNGFSQVVPVLSAAEKFPAPVLPTKSLEVQDVPEAMKNQPQPLMRIIMPIVMVLAMVAMVGFMVFSGSSLHPMMLMFPLMMAMSMLMMVQPPQANNIDEQRRTYLRHLVQLREQALEHATAQRKYELHWHCDPQTLWSLPKNGRLWERTSQDTHLGVVRIGLGTVPLCTPLAPAHSGAVEDLDPVCAVSLRHLLQRVNTVPDMPITLQLQAFGIVAIQGSKAREVARTLITQACFHHGPEVLALGLVAPAEAQEEEQWEAVKWLPHYSPDAAAASQTMRITVWDEPAVQGLVTHTAPMTAPAAVIDAAGAAVTPENPTTGAVTTPDDAATATETPARSTTTATTKPTASAVSASKLETKLRSLQRWATTVVLVDPPEELLELALQEGIVLAANERLEVLTTEGREDIGQPDVVSQDLFAGYARQLAGYRRAGSSADNSLDLRNLLQVGQLDARHIERLWGTENFCGHLAVPIGRDKQGKPLVIDIKEAALGGMGPHGLCIGATGSGKSELLRTLVVSLAATHSPEQLNLVLVDFKGGATFLGLEDLPHTSAVITNLAAESHLVERMHDAIAGEMHRRQEFLRTAGNFSNVREYNAQRQPDQPAIPALFIILDEFSELLGQHPDFADLFVAVGRLGRSLQIHLLLASQRLEEGRLRGLESHLSYRIGLKTFSAAESRQIVGTLDAYHLPQQPGHGFLRTDAGDPVQFRTSYVSGEVQEALTVSRQQVRRFGLHTTPADEVLGARHTLVDDCVQATREVAGELGQQAHRIWLPPLPPRYGFAELYPAVQLQESTAALQVHCGLIDRPFTQRQDILALELAGQYGHAVICGGPQSGKSTALRSLILELCSQYGSQHLRCYVLDFSSGALCECADLPQVVAVAGKTEAEKVRRVIAEIQGLLTRPAPWHTVLIIDDWLTLAQEYEDLVDELATIVREGLNVGIHVVLSLARWMGLRPVIRDLIAQRIELKLVEPLDSLIDRNLQAKLPSAPGRGLWNKEQVLLAYSDATDVRKLVADLQAAGVAPAPGLKMLPQQLDYAAIADTPGLVFALGGKHIEPWSWDPKVYGHILMFGSVQSGKSTAVATLLHSIARAGRAQYRVVLLDQRRTHLGMVDPNILAGYAAHSEAISQLITDTCITLEDRLPPADITPQALRDRSWWQGPEIVLVVEDAELLDTNQWMRLQKLLPHSRDIGLHVIVTHKIGTAAKALYQPFLAELRDQVPLVLIFDGDREDGPLFHVRPDAQVPGRAHVVAGGQQLGMFHIAQVTREDTATPLNDAELSDAGVEDVELADAPSAHRSAITEAGASQEQGVADEA